MKKVRHCLERAEVTKVYKWFDTEGRKYVDQHTPNWPQLGEYLQKHLNLSKPILGHTVKAMAEEWEFEYTPPNGLSDGRNFLNLVTTTAILKQLAMSLHILFYKFGEENIPESLDSALKTLQLSGDEYLD